MKLNPKEKAVLAGVLRDTKDLAGLDPKAARCALAVTECFRERRPSFTQDALNKLLDEVLTGLDVSAFMSART